MIHRQVNRRHGGLLAGAVAVLLLLLALSPNNVVVMRVTAEVAHLMSPQAAGDFNVGSRFEMWRDSVTLWREAPLFGVGLGDFERETERLVAEGRSGSTVVFGHAHGIYFDALATTGLVGLAAMLWFAFWRPFRIGWSAWRTAVTSWQMFYAVGVVVTVVGFLVFGLTEAWFSRNPMVRTYLMCLLIMMAGLAGEKDAAERSDCAA